MALTIDYQRLAEGGVWHIPSRTRIHPHRNPVEWKVYQAYLTSGGILLPADTAGQLDLAEAKAAKIEEINAYAAGLRNRVVRGRSTGEMASWIIKLLDGLAVQAGTASPFASLLPALKTALGLPTLPSSVNDALAKVRGITEAQHVALVMAPAGQFLVAEVALDAIRGKHCDAITAMTTTNDIVLYDWMVGWPAVPE